MARVKLNVGNIIPFCKFQEPSFKPHAPNPEYESHWNLELEIWNLGL
jgi:hypothetical protein